MVLHKYAHFLTSGTSESGIFIGGTPVQPVSNIAFDQEIRDFRISPEPWNYRYLTGGGGHSPLAYFGYGCSLGTSNAVIPLSSTSGTFQIGREDHTVVSQRIRAGASAILIFAEPTHIFVPIGLYVGTITGTPTIGF